MRIEIKDLNEYQSKALQFLKPDEFLKSVMHCAMGMVGEAGEFAELSFSLRDQRIGEIGDCMWYSAVLANVLGYQFKYVVEEAQHRRHTGYQLEFAATAGEYQALLWACRLIDRVKKSIFDGEELDPVMVMQELQGYLCGLMRMADKTSVSLLYAGEVNINKLDSRYKGGNFNASHAINRDYQTESAAAGVQIV